MRFRIFLEWDEQCGLLGSQVYPFRKGIEEYFQGRDYGNSIKKIGIIMSALQHDYKQRKRYKKDLQHFSYDILLDFFLIKHSPIEEKKAIIRRQVIEITEQTFSKYKFEDFDKERFLHDFREIVNKVEW